MNPTDFPAALRREMGRRGLSQAALARLAAVNRTWVNHWLCGRREPSFAAACRVADALGVPVDALRR